MVGGPVCADGAGLEGWIETDGLRMEAAGSGMYLDLGWVWENWRIDNATD